MIERTMEQVLVDFQRVLRAGRALEREYMDWPTVELEHESDQLEEGWEKFLSNTKLKAEANSTPRSKRAVATMTPTPHGSTKRRHPRKRLRSE